MEREPVPYGIWGVLALLAMLFACLLFPPLIIVFLVAIGIWTRIDEWRGRRELERLRADQQHLSGQPLARRRTANWTDTDYDRLFRDHPPTEPIAPKGGEAAHLAIDLGRTTGAISAQWNDARSAVLGQKSAASQGLRAYLRRRGWLG